VPPSWCAFGRAHALVVPAVAALLASSGSARADTADGGVGRLDGGAGAIDGGAGAGGETIDIVGERLVGSARAPGAASTVVDVAKFGGEVRSVAELLSAAPGVTIHASGGPGQAASLSLRGASADESLILLDGIPLQGPGGGSIDLATLPVSLLDRMVVNRGVLGAQLGAGALGGAVELQPRAVTGRAGGGVEASVGSFGTAQLAADGNTKFGQTGSALFGIQLDRTSGDYDFAARVPPEAPAYYGFTRQNADARRGSALLRVEQQLSDSAGLEVLLQGSAGDRGLPGPATAITLRSRALDQGGLAGARVSGQSGDLSWAVRTWARVDRVELRGVQLFSDCEEGPGCPRISERSAAVRAAGELELPLGDRQRLRAVIEGGGESIAGSPTGSHQRSLASLALSDDLQLPYALALHPALRLDQTGGDAAISPGLAATFHPAPPLELRAGAGLAFRPASFSELYLDQGGVLPNEQLAPERAWSADAGAAFRTPALTLAANVFWSSYSNLIVYEFFPPARVKPFNVGGARIAGLELQAVAELGHGFVAEGAYSFLQALNTREGLEDHHLSYRPPHRLFLRLARRGDRLEGYAEASYQSRMPRNQFDSAYLPSQTLINAGAGVRAIGPLWLDVELKNLLDDQTLEDLFQYPLPGLSLAFIARARL
jgi:vitamin B12 transporter